MVLVTAHRLRHLLPAATVAFACGQRPDVAAPSAQPSVAIVASEGGPDGARLVAIDEHGDRQFDLIAPVDEIVRDAHPAISPDGAWIVFASSRERPLDETSLWIAPLAPDAQPVRLTRGAWIDSHPTWTPDGRAIVFASTREGGDFDLWQLPIAGGRASGDPIALTSAPDHEVTPTIAPDGTIAYSSVRKREQGIESKIEERARDGAIRALTEGPGDASPAYSPDGKRVAFARPKVHAAEGQTVVDSDLWVLTRATRDIAPIVDVPITDESGPVWSRDGRIVFATSLLRGSDGKGVFSSVVHVDLQESPRRARMLADRAGAIARLTPAVVAISLRVPALRGDPEYLPELHRIMTDAIASSPESKTP